MSGPGGNRWDVIVGGNVRRLRLLKSMTQEDLAASSNLSDRHVGRIERADVSATVATLEAIADALDVTPLAFFQQNEP